MCRAGLQGRKAPGGRRRPLRRWLAAAAVLAGLIQAPAAAAGEAPADTLAAVQDRGVLVCGVGEIAGLAKRDSTGRYIGTRADFCRAIAAAVLRDPEAVTFVPLIASARFEALLAGDVDVLFAGTTWTLGREAGLGIRFATVTFYDGQGFAAHRHHGWQRLEDVEAARVCTVADTTSAVNLRLYALQTGKRLQPVESVTREGAWETFLARGCDLITNDRTALIADLLDRVPEPADYVVLPDMISREPLAPAVRLGDSRWEGLVRFVMHALILAEEKDITGALAGTPVSTSDPETRHLLGIDPGVGQPLGLDDDWARRAIAAAGNYGEIFDRHLGKGSRFGMPRGLNALWSDGGLLYPLPLR